MVSGLPPWAVFTPDGSRVRLRATDATRDWVLAFGRFTGTSPKTGKTYDDECAELVADAGDVAATVSGTAWDLDLWLWGRASEGAVDLTGEQAVCERLRAVIVESTQ